MRKLILQEGAPFPDGRMVKVGAMTWDEDAKLPVTLNFNYSQIVGVATDLRRETPGDGMSTADITAEITFNPNYLVPIPEDRMNFSCTSTGILGTGEDNNLTITSGHIREVTISDNTPWAVPVDVV